MKIPKTKRERHTFYKALLKQVCDDPDTWYGLCRAITLAGCTRCFTLQGDFPEIWIQKPARKKGEYVYWFPNTTKGWEKRIAIIEKAIEMTKPSNKA